MNGPLHLTLKARLEQISNAHTRAPRGENHIRLLLALFERVRRRFHRVGDDTQVDHLKVQMTKNRNERRTIRVGNE